MENEEDGREPANTGNVNTEHQRKKKQVLWSSGSGRACDANAFQVRSSYYVKLNHIVMFT